MNFRFRLISILHPNFWNFNQFSPCRHIPFTIGRNVLTWHQNSLEISFYPLNYTLNINLPSKLYFKNQFISHVSTFRPIVDRMWRQGSNWSKFWKFKCKIDINRSLGVKLKNMWKFGRRNDIFSKYIEESIASINNSTVRIIILIKNFKNKIQIIISISTNVIK